MSKFTIFNLQDHYEKEKIENERKKKNREILGEKNSAKYVLNNRVVSIICKDLLLFNKKTTQFKNRQNI